MPIGRHARMPELWERERADRRKAPVAALPLPRNGCPDAPRFRARNHLRRYNRLHGRSGRIPGLREPRDGQALGWSMGLAHTNGIESFWSLLKRATQGNVTQAERQAPSTVRERVRWSLQHPPARHARSDGRYRAWAGTEAAALPLGSGYPT